MKKQVAPRSVREVMTTSPRAVRPETSLPELRAQFEEYDFNCFPVVGPQDDLVGIVSKLDLLRPFRSAERGLRADRRAAMAERVVDVMSRAIVTIGPDDPLSEAIDLMIDYRLHSLPVVEKTALERRLVGILSRKDVLRWLSMVEEPGPAPFVI